MAKQERSGKKVEKSQTSKGHKVVKESFNKSTKGGSKGGTRSAGPKKE